MGLASLLSSLPGMDYYAELELAPDATPEDIKRQYRKLALQYHPDRNPGKETEVGPRFQAIGQAHEVLLDPEQRRKYDLSRQRGNLHATFPRQTNTSRRRDPTTFPTFDPPPKRDDPRYPPRRPEPSRYSTQPPPSTNGAGPGGGASRYSRFPNPPPPNTANTSSKQDAKARANVFNAWQSMHHTSKAQAQNNSYRSDPPPPPPRRPGHGPGVVPDLPPRNDIPTSGAFGRERPTSNERPNLAARGRPGYRVPPYFDRSTTSPREPGFTAASNAAPDGMNAAATGHANANHVPPPFYKTSAYPYPPQDDLGSSRDRTRRGPRRSRSGEDIPFSEGSNRHSTPYTANLHERTRLDSSSLRRSASTKDTTRWAEEAARQSKPEPERSRTRSVGRTPERSRTRSRPASSYSGIEVEEDDSMDGDVDDGPTLNSRKPHSPPREQSHPQQSSTQEQAQAQQQAREQTPPPEEMDIDPPPATGLDNMQDISQDLPNAQSDPKSPNGTGASAEPLNNMSDMASNLPNGNAHPHFHEHLSYRTQNPDLPSPPKAPLLPNPLNAQTWGAYLTKFSAYMNAWNTFNGQMISHFQDSALRSEDRMKGPSGGMVEGWLGAVGKANDLGDWNNYCEGMRHDDRVRTAWNVACERHGEAVEKHGRVRAKVLQGELGG